MNCLTNCEHQYKLINKYNKQKAKSYKKKVTSKIIFALLVLLIVAIENIKINKILNILIQAFKNLKINNVCKIIKSEIY